MTLEEINNKYNFIKKKIEFLLNQDEFISNTEYISAFDLKNIIYNELSELYSMLLLVDEKKKQINFKNNLATTIFGQKASHGLLSNIYITTNNEYNSIDFMFSSSYSGNEYFSICKYPESKELFLKKFNNQSNDKKVKYKKLIKSNIDFIENVFQTIEYYKENFNIDILWSSINANNLNQNFKFELFDIGFKFERNFPLITINSIDKEMEGIFTQDWLSKESIKSIVNKNKNKLLKRIPIKIDELNPLYKQIFTSSIEKAKVKERKK